MRAELLRKLWERIAKSEADLKNAEQMYIAVRDRCANVESDLAKSEAELALEREKNELLAEKLGRIESWCEAYPVEMFPQPDMEHVHRLLGDELLSQLSAYNMRHVIEGVKRIADRAQQPAPTEGASDGNNR